MSNKIDHKLKTNLDLIRDAFGRVVYTQTTHEYEAQDSKKSESKVKWGNLIVTALTFGGVLGVLAFNEQWLKLISALLSTLSLGIAIYQLSFNPEREVLNHKIAARELWYIREKYKNLICDVVNRVIREDEVRKRRDQLVEELKLVYKFSPSTSNKAYKKAQEALQMEEEQSFSQKELDNLLPESLRICKGKNPND